MNPFMLEQQVPSHWERQAVLAKPTELETSAYALYF